MSTRCLAAYHSICINPDGTLDPCCQYHRPDGVRPLRFTEFAEYQQTVQAKLHQDGLDNVRHTGCSKCWAEEDLGNPLTLRQTFDRWYGDNPSTEVSADNPIYHIELRLGNYCNLKCFMCTPAASTSLAMERQQHRDRFRSIGIYTDGFTDEHYWETEEFWQFSEDLLKNAQRINITGGEPFIIPEVAKFLDRLPSSVHISFNTNLTRLSPALIERLQRFEKLTIFVSLEGTQAHNDYLRYPSRWQDIYDNIVTAQYRIPRATISVNHTFQHASVYSLPALAELCYRGHVNLNLTLVQGDRFLTFDSVAPEDLARFRAWAVDTKCLQPKERQIVVNTIDQAQFDPVLHQQYHNYVALLDEIRGTNYYQAFDTETKLC